VLAKISRRRQAAMHRRMVRFLRLAPESHPGRLESLARHLLAP
jgi:hypothetical protein